MTHTDPRYSVIPARAASDTRLTLGDLRTLNALGVYADKHGECYPSYADVETRFGIPRGTSRRCVGRLHKFGYVEVVARTKLDGAGQGSNRYRLIHDDESAARRPEAEPEPVLTMVDTPMLTQVDTGVLTQAGATHAHLDELGPCSHGEQGKERPNGTTQKQSMSEDVDAIVASLRPLLSEQGKHRIKPKQAKPALKRLIEQYGAEPVRIAVLAFYSKAECRKNSGAYQPGLQVVCGDGRIEALIQPAAPPPDPLAEERWACAKRCELGRWPGGYSDASIGQTVRAEYPQIFSNGSAARHA